MTAPRHRWRRTDGVARRVLMAANLEAAAAGHARVGSEHLLLAIVAAGGGRGATWLRAGGIDAARLRTVVRRAVDRTREEARFRPGEPSSRRRRADEDDLVTALATVRGIRARDLMRDLGIVPDRLRAAVRGAGRHG